MTTYNLDLNLDSNTKRYDAITKGVVGDRGKISYYHTGFFLWTHPNCIDNNYPKFNVATANWNPTALDGYKKVNLFADGVSNVELWIKGDHTSVDVRYSNNVSPTSTQPKCESGSVDAANRNRLNQANKAVIPTSIDTTAFQNYFLDVINNPTKYENPNNWLYHNYVPDRFPIYFNDFYHIRTPIND